LHPTLKPKQEEEKMKTLLKRTLVKTLKSTLVAAALYPFILGSQAHAVLLGPSGGSGLSGEYAQFSDSWMPCPDVSPVFATPSQNCQRIDECHAKNKMSVIVV
jgi:hypothetical protein